jgi:hypothetical protein
VRPQLSSTLTFSCLLADPLGFEDPPSGILVAVRIRCWLHNIATTASFLRCVCPNPSTLTLSRTLTHACSTTNSADSTTTTDSLDGLHASVIMGSPSVSPRLMSRSHLSCCSPEVPCVSDALDQVSNNEVPIPCLQVPSCPLLSVHAMAVMVDANVH